VCASHGGAAGHVREAARRRLEELVLPAIATLRRLVANAETDAVALQAAKDVLDRAGLKAADKLAVDNEVRITVSYTDDVGILPAPGRSVAHQNGYQALTDGR